LENDLEDSNEIRHYIPQLLVPLKNKDDFKLPPSHLDYLNTNLPYVNDIMIIGWKGTEAKFQELLKNKLQSKKVNVFV
jgi:hypothetical protein